jgi:hypothetical protein
MILELTMGSILTPIRALTELERLTNTIGARISKEHEAKWISMHANRSVNKALANNGYENRIPLKATIS